MKGTSTIQMFTTTTAANAASIDMQDDGFIIGCYVEVSARGAGADGDGAAAEVSFGSTNQGSTNDARLVIAHVEITADVITAASAVNGTRGMWFNFGEGLPFFGGERIFLNTLALGSGTMNHTRVLLVISFKGGPVARRR